MILQLNFEIFRYSWLVAFSHSWLSIKFIGGFPVNKALSSIRRSARYDAVRVVNKGYSANMQAFEEFASESNSQKSNRSKKIFEKVDTVGKFYSV